MKHDDYMALRAGRLTVKNGLESMITDVGAGVYTYMVMLETLGRKREADFYHDIRERVFAIRSRVRDATTQRDFDEMAISMQRVYDNLASAQIFLSAHKPEEADILRSVANTACGLVHNLKNFLTP